MTLRPVGVVRDAHLHSFSQIRIAITMRPPHSGAFSCNISKRAPSCTWFAILLLYYLLVPITGSVAAEKVTILIDADYAPYTHADHKGDAAGIYIAILKQADERIPEFEIEFKPVAWKRALLEIESGTSFAILPPYYRPETRPYIDRYSTPILTEEVIVLCNKEKIGNLKVDNYPTDLRGLTVGNNISFRTPGNVFFDMVSQGHITLEEAPTTEINIRKLKLGRIDCYIQDQLAIARAIIAANLNQEDLVTVAVIASETGHIGYSRDFTAPYRDKFITAIDEAIEEMRRAGEIDMILNQWM